jgi:transposase-like protein
MPVKDLCRKHGFSDAAFYKWRGKYGGMQVSEASAKCPLRKFPDRSAALPDGGSLRRSSRGRA